MKLNVNGADVEVGDVDPSTPLLWVLRDKLQMVGTKFGCGIAQCGACTVQMGGRAVRSCSIPASVAAEYPIVTVEGLANADGSLSPLQQAWVDIDVPQCGYCQAGQLMSASVLLQSNANPTDADIEAAMAGNLCRCGTYTRIKAAIHAAASPPTNKGLTNEDLAEEVKS